MSRKRKRDTLEPFRCSKCGAGPLGNCGYYGCETPRETCPLKATPAPKEEGGARG